MSRLARINRSLVALVIGQLLQVATHLLVTPMYLTRWGALLYGTWLTVSAAVSYLAFADIGITAYVMPRLMRAYTSAEWSEFDLELHSATAAILMLIGAATIVGVAAVAASFFFGASSNILVIGALLGAQGLMLLMQSFVALPYSIVARPERAYANATLYSAAMLGGNFVVLLVGGGPIHLAGTQLAITGVRLVGTWWDALQIAPRARPGLAAARLTTVRMLLPKSVERSLANVAMLLGQQGTLLSVSARIGVSAAASLSTHRTLVNFARLPSATIANALYVEFTELHVRNDSATAAQLLRVMTAFAVCVTFPILGALTVFGPAVYEIWIRGKLPTNRLLFALLCAEVLVVVPVQLVRTVLLSSNQHRLSVWVECGTTVGVVISTLLCSRWIGILAAPLSVVTLQAPIFGIVVLREVHRVLGASWDPRAFYRILVKGLLLASASALLSLAVGLATHSPLTQGAIALVSSEFLGLVFLVTAVLTSEDRKMVSHRAQRMFPRVHRAIARTFK